MRRGTLALAIVLSWGCARATEAPRSAVRSSSSPTRDDAEAARRFVAWERTLLTDLATVDPRLSLRLRISPTEAGAQREALGAILAEDVDLRVIDGRADIFSFDTRARELDAIQKRARTPPRAPEGGAEAAFEALEVELMGRLATEERARVNEERRLPRSGSELLRGVVATWIAPARRSELQDRDGWLSTRLDEIRDSLGREPLSSVEISELEDALDPIERLADPEGFARSEGAVARLRIALGAARAATSSGMGWDALSEGLSVHLGIRESDADLRLQIDSTETRLREETAGRLARLSEDIARSAQRASAELLLVDGECEGQSGRSPMRSAGPPPERSAVCGVLRAIAQAKTESDEVAALLAVHDAVVVAQWAVGIHIDGWEAERAQQGHALTGFVPPERMGRFIRFAATRPIACIAVARMASLLGGADGRRARAKLWLAFGDAPLDIVEREWGAK